jgi:recombination protein RecT
VALIPYKGIVTVVPMYRGLLKLVLDAGRYVDVQCEIIYEHDDFHFQRGDQAHITHTWKLGEDRGQPIGGYTIFTEANGRTHFDVVDWPYIQGIKKRATAARKSSPWDTDEIEMARKTCLRHAVKYVALGEDAEARDRFERAVELDNADFEVPATEATDSHPIPNGNVLEQAKAKMEAAKAKMKAAETPPEPERRYDMERKTVATETGPEPPPDVPLPGDPGYVPPSEEQEERAAMQDKPVTALQDEQPKAAPSKADSQQASGAAWQPTGPAPKRKRGGGTDDGELFG